MSTSPSRNPSADAAARTSGGAAGLSGPAGARSPAIEAWVNEGGSLPPAREAAVKARPRKTGKSYGDTPEGCRERASADLASAREMDTDNGRLRLEHSAATWLARAKLLQRLSDSHDARMATQASSARESAREAGTGS